MAWISPLTLHDPVLTPTVRLVPLEARHAPDLLAAADPELFRYGSQHPPEWSVAGFEREIAKVLAFPGVVAFAIVLASGPEAGRAIGRTTYMDIRPEHRAAEIGRTWFARRFHGSRVNPEAKYLLLRHAFEGLAPTALRVQITANAANAHSRRAIEKLGAVQEGVQRDARILPPFPMLPGREAPVVCDWATYSILAREWPAVKDRLEARLSVSSRGS